VVSQHLLLSRMGNDTEQRKLRNRCLELLPLVEGWIKRADAQPAEMETGKEVKLSLLHPVLSSVRQKVSVPPAEFWGFCFDLAFISVCRLFFFRLEQ